MGHYAKLRSGVITEWVCGFNYSRTPPKRGRSVCVVRERAREFIVGCVVSPSRHSAVRISHEAQRRVVQDFAEQTGRKLEWVSE